MELLVNYDEYEKEREEATENVDDDEEDHERRTYSWSCTHPRPG